MRKQTMFHFVLSLLTVYFAMSGVAAQWDGDGDSKLDVCFPPINCTNNAYTNKSTANPDNCDTYFICRDDLLYIEPCPAGTTFDYIANKCDVTLDRCKPLCKNREYLLHVFTTTTQASTGTTAGEITSESTTDTVVISRTASDASTKTDATSTLTTESVIRTEEILTTEEELTSIKIDESSSLSVSTDSGSRTFISSSTLKQSTSTDHSSAVSTKPLSATTAVGQTSTTRTQWTMDNVITTLENSTEIENATRGLTTVGYSTTTTEGTPTLTLTLTDPYGLDPVEDQRVKYQCVFRFPQSSGSPFQRIGGFVWSIGGMPLPTNLQSGRVKIEYPSTGVTGEFMSTLEFSKVKISDAGLIECDVTYNGPFVMKAFANLTVLIRPAVSIYPLALSKHRDADLLITCTLVNSEASSSSSRRGLSGGTSSNDNTTILWWQNGLPISSNEKINVTYTPDNGVSELFARNIVSNGNFSCMAVNSVTGNSSVQSCRVTVLQSSDRSCAEEYDPVSGITWRLTGSGQTALEPCPAGATGTVSRKCNDGRWAAADSDECVSHEITDLLSQIELLNDGIGSENSTYVTGVAQQLENFTSKPSVLNVANLQASVDAIGGLAGLRQNNTQSFVAMQEVQFVVSSISNVMGPSSMSSWEKIQQKLNGTAHNNNNNNNNQNPAVKLMSSTDQYGLVLSKQQIEGSSSILPSENLVLSATMMKKSSLDESLSLPLSHSSSRDWFSQDDVIVLDRDTLMTYTEGDTISVSSSYYRNLNAIIQPISSEDFVGSLIVAVTVKELEGKRGLAPKINITLTHNKTEEGMNTSCVFWRYTSASSGHWSYDGCTRVGGNETHTLCQCDHLTNFAILMSRNPRDNVILSLISLIGCCISIAAMVLTIVFYCLLWKHVRSHHAVVLINLCIALIIANGLFIGGVDKTDPQVLCKVIAALLHYFYLASFFIMLAEGVEMLLYIIFVFHVRRKLETALLVFAAWFTPAVIVGVSLGITGTVGYGGEKSCWLSVESGLLWAFVGPALFVCLLNLIIVVLVLVRISQSRFQMDKEDKRNRVRSTIWNILVICPILGTTWIFGVLSLAFNSIVFQYIFAVSNSLQGLFIFIFHVLFNNRKTKGKLVLSFTSTICMGRDSSKTASRSSNSNSGTRSRTQRPSTSPMTGTSSSGGPVKSFSSYPSTTVKTVSSNNTVKTDVTMLETMSVANRQISTDNGASNGRYGNSDVSVAGEYRNRGGYDVNISQNNTGGSNKIGRGKDTVQYDRVAIGNGRAAAQHGRGSETMVRNSGKHNDAVVGADIDAMVSKDNDVTTGRNNDVIVGGRATPTYAVVKRNCKRNDVIADRDNDVTVDGESDVIASRDVDVIVGTTANPRYVLKRNGRIKEIVLESSSSFCNSRRDSDESSASVREECSSNSSDSIIYNERQEISRHLRYQVNEESNLLNGASRRRRLDSVEENDDSSASTVYDDTMTERVNSTAVLTENSDKMDSKRISRSRENITSIYPEKGIGERVVEGWQYGPTTETNRTSHTHVEPGLIEFTSL